MQMGKGSQDDTIQKADEGIALNVQDIDAYWLRFLHLTESLNLAIFLLPYLTHHQPPSRTRSELHCGISSKEAKVQYVNGGGWGEGGGIAGITGEPEEGTTKHIGRVGGGDGVGGCRSMAGPKRRICRSAVVADGHPPTSDQNTKPSSVISLHRSTKSERRSS
nr:DExH-box ATP-dependent RNA helicase DExH12-like [Ipomoea batatas]